MKSFVTKTPIKADSNGQVPTTINLLKAGTWNTPWHGSFELSGEDLEEMAANFAEGVGLVVEDQPKAPINEGHNMGGKASGWIKRIYVRAVNGTASLMGDVEWTPAAIQAIKDKEYAYISPEFNPRGCPWEDPEQEFTFVDNVLTGAALTNIPLFKKLQPITASRVPPTKAVKASRGSEESDKSNQGERMNVEELRAKEVKDLTDEEKQFLVDNKAELTAEERTNLGLTDDGDDEAAKAAAEAEAKAKADKEAADAAAAEEARKAEEATKIEASAIAGRVSELEKQLKASREEADALRTKIDTKEVNEFLNARIAAGQIKQDQRESWANTLLASRGDARKALETQLEALPANEAIGKELGDAGRDAKVQASTELHQKVVEKIAASREAGKVQTYYQAQKEILASDTALAARVKEEEEA
ncbi:phage protease [Dietzia maris]|uniref:phage protease n=1 Tax=Dietzia maris TaxID=37915 RepID=UPI0037CB705F